MIFESSPITKLLGTDRAHVCHDGKELNFIASCGIVMEPSEIHCVEGEDKSGVEPM